MSALEESAKLWNKPPPPNKHWYKNSVLQIGFQGLFEDFWYWIVCHTPEGSFV